MTRPYLNELSFKAPDVDTALDHLAALRKGIARLLLGNLLKLPVMCNHRASQLPITPDYKTLPSMVGHQGGRYRDTILFFLQVLDQRAPVYADSAENVHIAANNHIVVGQDDCAPISATMALVTCSLEAGVLLSLKSEDRWARELVELSVMLDGMEDSKKLACRNVSDEVTANCVAEELTEEQAVLVLENWDAITSGARKSDQVDKWLEDTLRHPGLTQLVLRTVGAAMKADYFCDGELIKKLNSSDTVKLYEVRAYYQGSNNVRLLFIRSDCGTVTYRFAGRKNSPNWYDHAISQAIGN